MTERINEIDSTRKILPLAIRVPLILFRIGFWHSLYLLYICFILPVIMKLLPKLLLIYRAARLLIEKVTADVKIRYWIARKSELLQAGQKGYRLKIEEFGLDQQSLEELKQKQQGTSVSVVIAEIDQDGFLLSNFGDIRDAAMVEQSGFLPRKRFGLKVVALGDYVGIQKHYAGKKTAFVNELQALHKLTLAGCNVPAIMDVDFENLILTISYIRGAVLREELAKKGAVLRDRDVDNDPAYQALPADQKPLSRITQGRRFLYDVINEAQAEQLYDQLRKIHKTGIILKDIKYGNIIIEARSAKLYLIDFDYARNYSSLGKNAFRIMQDKDIESFNLHFDTSKLTYKRLR